MPQPGWKQRSRRLHLLQQPDLQPRLLPYGEIHYPPAGRGQAVLCTQISGDEVSRLFPGLYQYVWRTGRPEAEIRGSLVGRRGGGPGHRHPSGLYARQPAGLSGGDEPAYIPFSGVRHREYRRQDTLPHQPRAYFPCRRRCGGKNRFTRNPDRWACHPRTAGRDARKHRGTSRRTVPSAAHYPEDASAATDKGYAYGP